MQQQPVHRLHCSHLTCSRFNNTTGCVSHPDRQCFAPHSVPLRCAVTKPRTMLHTHSTTLHTTQQCSTHTAPNAAYHTMLHTGCSTVLHTTPAHEKTNCAQHEHSHWHFAAETPTHLIRTTRSVISSAQPAPPTPFHSHTCCTAHTIPFQDMQRECQTQFKASGDASNVAAFQFDQNIQLDWILRFCRRLTHCPELVH